MKKMPSWMLYVALIVVILGGLIGINLWKKNAPSPLDGFAQCISDAGGKMYGAYWCSHCAEQKAMLGSAFRKINYVECSSPRSSTFDLCPDIESTPTWETKDGTRVKGTQTLDQLAEMYSCQLPTTQ